ncbi:MAG TPA: DUF2780 domain-containing protein [Bryobacteraceae bacterium]|jgi:hypothetical protein
MKTRITLGLLVFFVICVGQAFTQSSDEDVAKTASPELVGQLTKALSITPAQASGGAGALFGLAKSRLSAADFSKVAASVPGMEGLIKSAPAASKNSAASGLSGLGNALPGGLGSLAAVAGPFKKLGLSPDMAAKFVPLLTQYVGSKGGGGVAALLSGALK